MKQWQVQQYMYIAVDNGIINIIYTFLIFSNDVILNLQYFDKTTPRNFKWSDKQRLWIINLICFIGN